MIVLIYFEQFQFQDSAAVDGSDLDRRWFLFPNCFYGAVSLPPNCVMSSPLSVLFWTCWGFSPWVAELAVLLPLSSFLRVKLWRKLQASYTKHPAWCSAWEGVGCIRVKCSDVLVMLSHDTCLASGFFSFPSFSRYTICLFCTVVFLL